MHLPYVSYIIPTELKITHMSRKLIVMIPCLNEAKTLPLVINSIPKTIAGIDTIEVLVVNDGSQDKSVEVAKKLNAHVLSHKINKGLGQTFRDGIEAALNLGADIIVNIDGDNQFNSADIAKLVKPIVDNEADFVTATRYKEFLDYNLAGRGIKNFGNKLFTSIINRITRSNFTDVSCGFRAYSREVAQKLQLFGHFTYTHETFLDIAHKKFVIVEIPVKVAPKRQNGKSHISGNLVKYGYSAVKIIVRGFRDHEPLRFFGYLGFLIMLFGVLFGALLILWYSISGSFTPYKTLGFVSGFLLAFGFLIVVLGLIADMLGRIRDIEEEILYRVKTNEK